MSQIPKSSMHEMSNTLVPTKSYTNTFSVSLIVVKSSSHQKGLKICMKILLFGGNFSHLARFGGKVWYYDGIRLLSYILCL
jgi:hypothetical protein